MGTEIVSDIRNILEKAGIYALEAYPSGEMIHIDRTAATVEVRSIKADSGLATVSIRVLSPRAKGGNACGISAGAVLAALMESGISGESMPMEYLHRLDCYAIAILAAIPVKMQNGVWSRQQPWKLKIDGIAIDGILSFSAEQRQERRLIGSICQRDPVGISPGAQSGWRIMISQKGNSKHRMPLLSEVPFYLEVLGNPDIQKFNGCLWDGEEILFEGNEELVKRWGYALSREVIDGKTEI